MKRSIAFLGRMHIGSRRIILFVFLLLAFCFFRPFTDLYAADNATIAIDAVETSQGDTVRLAVTLSDNPGICNFRLAVNYAPELVLINVEDAGLYGDPLFGNDLNANPYYITWDESLETIDNTGNGSLAYLLFKVDEEADPGMYRVWITYEVGDVYNLNLDDIDLTLVSGGVTVLENALPASVTVAEDENRNDEKNCLDESSQNSGSLIETENENDASQSSAENNQDDLSSEQSDEGQSKAGGQNAKSDGTAEAEQKKEKENKPFIFTINGTEGQTIKYRIYPEGGSTDGTAGRATLLSLKTEEVSITIPDEIEIYGKTYQVTVIGKRALKYSKKIKQLYIGSNIISIGKNAFKSLKKLKSIFIGSGKLSEIGNGAFKGISKKASIKIKATKKAYNKIVALIKASSVGKNVKIVRVK